MSESLLLVGHDRTQSTVFVVTEVAQVYGAAAAVAQGLGLAVRHCARLADLLALANTDLCGCLLIDTGQDGNTGPELLQQLQHEGISVPVIFTADHVELPVATQVVRAGAVDFLQKPIEGDLLGMRIEEAVRRDCDQRRQRREAEAASSCFAQLSAREREVADLLARGLNTKSIAAKLSISPKTVDTHRAHLFEKLEVSNIAALVKLMVRREPETLNRN